MYNIDIRNTRDYVGIASDMFNFASNKERTYTFAYFDDAVLVLRELLQYNAVLVGSIDIAKMEDNLYDKEYYISLDENMVLYVEPAYQERNEWHDAGYAGFEADQVIVGEGTNYKQMIRDVHDNEFA